MKNAFLEDQQRNGTEEKADKAEKEKVKAKKKQDRPVEQSAIFFTLPLSVPLRLEDSTDDTDVSNEKKSRDRLETRRSRSGALDESL